MPPSAKMTSTLRLFTRSGREDTFSTTLVEDGFTRPLRALVDSGFLTMEYTGTKRVYTLTPQGRVLLEGKRMGKKKPDRPKDNAPPPPLPAPAAARETPAATNGHVRKRRTARQPAASVPTLDPKPSAPRQKKRERRATPPPPPPPTRPSRGQSAVSALDVIRLMREVRDYADAHEGVDELLVLIRRVEELGQRFGGLDCVRESLEAIREFRREK